MVNNLSAFITEKIFKHKEFGMELSWNVFYRCLLILSNLISGMILSRDLGDVNRGIFQLFNTSLGLFAIFFNFGLNSSAYYYANKKADSIRSYLASNIVLSCFSAVIIAMLLLLGSQYLNFRSNLISMIFIICYFVYSLSAIYRSFMVGIGHNLYLQKIDAGGRLSFLVFVVICHFLGCLSIPLVISFMVLEYIATSILSHRKINIDVWPLKIDLDLIKESYLFNGKSYLMSILIFLINRGDQYIVKYLQGNVQVGYYGIGNTIIENLGVVAALLATIYLSKFLSNDDLEWKLVKLNRLLPIVFFFSLGVAIVFYFVAPYLLEYYFKKQNDVAVQSFRILLIGYVFWSMCHLIFVVSASLRYKKSNIIILTVVVLLNLVLNYNFIPVYGILASAIASSLCYFLIFAFSYIDLYCFKLRNHRRKLNQI